MSIISQWCFLGSSAGKESACNAGDPSSIPESGEKAGGEQDQAKKNEKWWVLRDDRQTGRLREHTEKTQEI